MSAKRRALGFAAEVSLWSLANMICIGVPAALIAAAIHYGLVPWGRFNSAFYLLVTVLLTSTWGSWGTLIWTKSRPLRALQQAVTLIPGVLTVGAGSLLIYTGMVKMISGLMVVASGIGMLAAAVLLVGGVFTANRLPNWRQIVYGLTIYPVATTSLGAVVAGAWYWFTRSGDQSWRSFFTVATMMVTVLALSLITTIIPAALSRAARELAAAGCQDDSCSW